MVTRFESSSQKRDSSYHVWWRARKLYGEALVYKARELLDAKALALLLELATRDKRSALKRLVEQIIQETTASTNGN